MRTIVLDTFLLIEFSKRVIGDTGRSSFSWILEAEFKSLGLRNKRKQMNEENKCILSFQEVGLYIKKKDTYLEE